LYLALRSPYVTAQLKSLATGSVVDALNVEPSQMFTSRGWLKKTANRMGKAAERAWEEIAEYLRLETEIVDEIESAEQLGVTRIPPHTDYSDKRAPDRHTKAETPLVDYRERQHRVMV
jgi:hypothetical protein